MKRCFCVASEPGFVFCFVAFLTCDYVNAIYFLFAQVSANLKLDETMDVKKELVRAVYHAL